MAVDPELTKDEGLPLGLLLSRFSGASPGEGTLSVDHRIQLAADQLFSSAALLLMISRLSAMARRWHRIYNPSFRAQSSSSQFRSCPTRWGSIGRMTASRRWLIIVLVRCAPCLREKVMPRFELDAGLLQAGTVVGLIFLLP